MPMENCIMMFNGKGGVAKTSLTANLAGLIALSGSWRVLAVDLDVQGNLARDLGCMDRSDEGEGLLRAAVSGVPLQPLKDVRPNLDFVPGGRHLREAVRAIGDDPMWLDRALAPLAENYDLVLIDSPPGVWQLHEAGACVAGQVLIPTLVDDASVDGLAEVVDQVVSVRETHNPDLELLGVVLTLVPRGSTRIIASARARLEELLEGTEIPVFEATLRHTIKAGIEGTRNKGRLAHEYEEAAATTPRTPWWKRLKGEVPEGTDEEDFSSAASGLAQDYQDITEAVIGEYLARLQRRRDAKEAVGG